MALPKMEVRVTADTADAEAGFDRVGNAARQNAAAVNSMSQKMGRASQQFTRAANENGRLRSQIQNTSYQVQDFAVQVASGTSATRALAQQLPQLLGPFGALGAVLGTVAAIAIPLAAHFLDMSEYADELGAVLERFAVTGGAVATVFAVKWVGAMAAARIATLSFATALGVMRKALIVTGIGAAVVVAGELLYQFAMLAKGAGSITKAFDMVAKAVGLSFETAGAHISKFYFGIIENIARAFGELAESIGAEETASVMNEIADGFAIRFAAARDRIREFTAEYNKAVQDIIATQQEAESLLGASRLFGGSGDTDEENAKKKEDLDRKRNYARELVEIARAAAEEEKQIEAAKRAALITNTGSLFGALANLAQAGGKKTAGIAKAFGIAEAIVNTYVGATNALRTVPFPANFAAAAAVIANGLASVMTIASVNTNGGTNSTGGGASGSAAAAPPPPKPLEVLVQGLGPNDLITGGQLSSLFDKLVDEAGDRGIKPVFA